MSVRGALVAAFLATIAVIVWRSQLFTVARPGDRPRALEIRAPAARVRVDFDVALPAVPVGVERLTPGGGVLLVHYWAPWERHSLSQAALLDSLRHDAGLERLRVVIVCFDPFPSVARYVGRNRLRVPVLLDGRHALAPRLPCPSIPYTYVIDASGRIAAAQPGEILWLAPGTLEALTRLLREPEVVPEPSARGAT